jgi:molecular chaperone HtpG
LADYVARMKDGQKHIYYIAGESVANVRDTPFTERLQKKGIEVLYMVDTMDEYLTQKITEYDGKKLVNVAKEGALEDLGELDADEAAEAESFKPLCEKFAAVLGDKVEKVVPSMRLTETPAILVSSQYGWTANMERIMKAQALQNNTMSRMMSSKKVMEINPRHRMIRALNTRLNEKSTEDMIQLIYEGSMIRSGFGLENPGFFVGRVYRMIEIGLNLDDEAEGSEAAEAIPETSEAAEAVMETLD